MDRDVLTPYTPARGVVLAPYVDEDVTGRFDTGTLTVEQRDRLRDGRPTDAAIAHHDRRLDAHDSRLGAVEFGQVRLEGKVDTVAATQAAHTAILGSQSTQLDRLLNERSAEHVVQRTAGVERRTATYKTALAIATPIVTLVIGALATRGC